MTEAQRTALQRVLRKKFKTDQEAESWMITREPNMANWTPRELIEEFGRENFNGVLSMMETVMAYILPNIISKEGK